MTILSPKAQYPEPCAQWKAARDGRVRRIAPALSLFVLTMSGKTPLLDANETVSAGTGTADLEEVTVTALKRTQSLKDVPLSMAAFTAATMERDGISDIGDLSRLVPALETELSTRTTTETVRLRRVGNIGNIPTFEPSVGVFIDGAYRSRSVFGAGDLFDLNRVEVINGPQSTLYGKNVTAGVFAIYTAVPGNQWVSKAEVTVGAIDSVKSAALYQAKGGISGPLSDSVRASVGGSWSYNQDTTGQALINSSGPDAYNLNRYALRGQLQWSVSDWVDTRLILGSVQEHDNAQVSDLYYDPSGFVPLILRSWQAAGISIPCTDNDPTNRIGCGRLTQPQSFQSEEATLILDFAMRGGLKLTSLTSWDHFKGYVAIDDVAQMSAAVLRFHDTQLTTNFQEELRLTSPGGERVDWLAGAFYYRSHYNEGDNGRSPTFLFDTYSADPTVVATNQALLGVPLPIAAPGQLGYMNNTQDTEYSALFGQATWKLLENVSISGGARWQQERKNATIANTLNDPTASFISLMLTDPSLGGALSRKTTRPTWSLTGQFYLSERSMLYATAASGFKSGGYNVGYGSIPLDSREFKDETVMNYEAGIKTASRDGRIQANISAFHTLFHNYQDGAFVGGKFTVGNAQIVSLNGFETNLSASMGHGITASLATSYAALKYVENLTGQCYPGLVPDSPGYPGACDLSGATPNNAPLWRTSTALQYEHGLTFGDAYVRADWSWSGDYNTSASLDPRLVQPSYSWVTLRVGLKLKTVEAVLWMNNALNATVMDHTAPLNLYAGDGSYQAFLQQGRSLGVTFRILP